MKTKLLLTLAALGVATVSAHAQANVQVTEIMYTGLFGEFVEIVNVGNADQDMTNWKFSDNRRGTTGSDFTSLTDIGTLSVNEVAIITEVSDTIFTQAWYTEPSKTALALSNIISNNSINLGRSDEVNIYPASGTTHQDRMTYNDQGAAPLNGPRSEDNSAKVGPNGVNETFDDWTLSATGSPLAPTGNAWKAGVSGAPGPFGSPGTYPN